MDEAGSLAKLGEGNLPEEVVECQRRIQFIVRRLEASIQNHEFEKARFDSDQESRERESLRALREKLRSEDSKAVPQVTVADVERVISDWTGLRVESVRKLRKGRQE